MFSKSAGPKNHDSLPILKRSPSETNGVKKTGIPAMVVLRVVNISDVL